MYHIATLPNYNYYRVQPFSFSHIVIILAFLAAILIPFFLVFSTNGFYMNIYEIYQQPSISFTSQYYINVLGKNYQAEITNLYKTQKQLSLQALPSNIQILEQDTNDDSKNDYFTFTADIAKTSNPINQISVLLFFTTSSQYYSTNTMLHFSFSGYNVASAYSVGSLELVQNTIVNSTFNYLDSSNPFSNSIYDISNSFSSYYQRPLYFRHETSQQIFNDDTENTKIKISLNLQHKHRLFVNPSVFQQIQYSWSQYCPLCLIFLFFTIYILRFAFRYHLLQTRICHNNVQSN